MQKVYKEQNFKGAFGICQQNGQMGKYGKGKCCDLKGNTKFEKDPDEHQVVVSGCIYSVFLGCFMK